MPAGAKPGERRGGRAKGTPNKITVGKQATDYRAAQSKAEDIAASQDKQQLSPEFDSLEYKRKICFILFTLVAEEQNKRVRGEKWDPRWLKDAADAADRALNGLLPYEHRKLATLEPAMEAIVKPDGSVSVKISRVDDDL
jgi:hypothetical protein